jgi:hypothetical protein
MAINVAVPSATTSSTVCVDCKKAIVPGASKCASCGTYQGPIRRYLPRVEGLISLLSLITALVAVIALAHDALQPSNSNVSARVLSMNQQDKTVKLLLTNSGTRPALIEDIVIMVPQADGKTQTISCVRQVIAGTGGTILESHQSEVVELTPPPSMVEQVKNPLARVRVVVGEFEGMQSEITQEIWTKPRPVTSPLGNVHPK